MDKKTTTLIIGIMVFAIVALTIFLIVTVASSSSKKNAKVKVNEQILELTDNEKVEINDQMLNDYITQFIIAQKFEIDTSVKDKDNTNINIYAEPKIKECSNYEFTDKLILDTAAVSIIKSDSNSKKKKEGTNLYTLKVDEIQTKAKLLFGREVELTKVNNKVQNGYIDIEVNPNMNLVPYKVKEIKLNKTKSEYTLTFDYVKYTEENYSANKIDYNSSDVISTYSLKIKAIKDEKEKNKVNYIFKSLGC